MAMGAQRTDVVLLILKKAALLIGVASPAALMFVACDARPKSLSVWCGRARPGNGSAGCRTARCQRAGGGTRSGAPGRFN